MCGIMDSYLIDGYFDGERTLGLFRTKYINAMRDGYSAMGGIGLSFWHDANHDAQI